MLDSDGLFSFKVRSDFTKILLKIYFIYSLLSFIFRRMMTVSFT